MQHNDFMVGLVKAATQVCHTNEKVITLNPEQTGEFFKNRRIWSDHEVGIICREGELVQLDLPNFPLPVRTNTVEEYSIGPVSIIPAYQYHSIVNFILSRIYTNLIPTGMRI